MYKAPLSAESLMEQEVRQLFERHTIAEIKVREDLTRDEIEKKKHELRRLVGTRYRDLIDSADSVIAMKTAAEGLAGCFERLDHHTARLLAHLRKPGPTAANGNGAATDSASGGEEERNRAAHRERYHVALQVKLLVDAPEQIWSSVEANDYLKATLLYTRAEQAHSRLVHNPAFAQLLKSIPLMPRQWSLISQFPSEIRQNARAQLQKSGVSPQHYAGSLCALVLLDHLSVTQALNVFLEAQKTLVLSLFDTSSSNASNALPLEELVERMCRLVRWVQNALFLLGIVFSSHFAATAFGLPASLLTQCLRAPDTTSLTAASSSSSSSQQTIAEADLERGCKMWLDSIAESLRWGLRHALLQIKLAKDLDHIRQRVLQAMDNPEFPAVPGDVTKFPSAEEIWKHVCGLVIKRGLDVWDFVFNEAFTEASRNVIQLWFRSVNLGLVSSSDALNLLRSDEDLSMGHYVWRVEAGRMGAAATPLSRRGEAFDTLRQKAATLTPRLSELVGHLDHQLEACMLDLAHLLHHLTTATSTTTDWHGSGSGTYSTRRRRVADAGSGSTAAAAGYMGSEEEAEREARRREREEKERGRELKLREFLQDSCHQALSALLAQLDDKLTALAQSEAGGKEQQQMSVEERTEQALFIGRACRAIVQHSVQLKRIFALPKTTQPGVDAGALKVKGYSYTAKAFNRRLALKHSQDEEADNVLHPKLQELQSTFRRLSLRAHVRWVHILAHTLLARLGEALQADDWSEREKRRMQWQPITVAVESLDEGGKGQAAKGGSAKTVVEETFYLPYQASPYVLSFLFSACREIHRTFAHAPDHAVLHYLASQLLLGVCGHYWRLANAAEVRERVSKEGAIQLMFDAKFLCDALAAGASPPHAADPDLAKAVLAESATSNSATGDLAEPSAIKDRIKAIHNQLQTLLDPIDRAFYGPHVNRMEQQCYARSAALLGPLVSLHPLYTDVKVQGAHGDQYNTLPMVASAPRFRYLPITEPVVKGKEKGPVASSFGLDLPSGYQQQHQQQLPQFAGDRFGARLPSSPLLSASTPATGGADGSVGVVAGSFMEQVRKFGFGGFLGAEDGSALGSATLKSFLS